MSEGPPTWAQTRRMILPALYRALRQWPTLTASTGIVLAALVALAWVLTNTGQPDWGGFTLALAVLIGMCAAAGIIAAATITLARSTVADILPIPNPPSTFRALAIMAATTVPLALLSSEFNIGGLAMAETIMLTLFAGTAAAAFIRPQGTIETASKPA